MGCDVHAGIFVRAYQIKDGRKDERFNWDFVAEPDSTRCYPFFAALAGVRDGYGGASSEPIVRDRGFPEWWRDDDYCSATVDGDQSPNWFSLGEARKYDAGWLKNAYPPGDWPYRQWQRWVNTMEFYAKEYELNPEDVVAVFNFDS